MIGSLPDLEVQRSDFSRIFGGERTLGTMADSIQGSYGAG